ETFQLETERGKVETGICQDSRGDQQLLQGSVVTEQNVCCRHFNKSMPLEEYNPHPELSETH
ncbi:hypothetical protein KUCAC02_015133, partial [Chaenocephalus aceratus]